MSPKNMEFLNTQKSGDKQNYLDLLKMAGALSNLFADSKIPYLNYRVAENVFCRAFGADNLSRSDCSVDARKGNLGIGLKTYIDNNGRSYQKVAEFNKIRSLYSGLENKPDKLIDVIAGWRNKRIDFTKATYNLNNIVYHCVARDKGGFLVFEEQMMQIELKKIKVKGHGKANTISFEDGLHEYSFNLSKNTLFKRFNTAKPLILPINIIKDPFSALRDCFSHRKDFVVAQEPAVSILLPLYSKKGGIHVPEKSGLNQWNAGGRPRSLREVYIGIPSWIHEAFQNFFPTREKQFNLHLPNKKILSAKICQENDKALMSNPNTALGEWLIDEVLKIKPGEIVTYELLEEIGTDCVEIIKIDEDNFSIDFRPIGKYEDFEISHTE